MRIVAARVTLDTNVYISAFQFGGMRLLHMAVNGDIEIAVSQAIIEEVIRVLRDKFRWDGYRLQDAKQQILTFARLVTPAQTLDVVKDKSPIIASSNAPRRPDRSSSSPPIRICCGWEATLAPRSCGRRIFCKVRTNNRGSRVSWRWATGNRTDKCVGPLLLTT